MSRLGLPILGTGSADQTAKVAFGDLTIKLLYGDEDDHSKDDGTAHRSIWWKTDIFGSDCEPSL